MNEKEFNKIKAENELLKKIIEGDNELHKATILMAEHLIEIETEEKYKKIAQTTLDYAKNFANRIEKLLKEYNKETELEE